MQEFKPIKHD